MIIPEFIKKDQCVQMYNCVRQKAQEHHGNIKYFYFRQKQKVSILVFHIFCVFSHFFLKHMTDFHVVRIPKI